MNDSRFCTNHRDRLFKYLRINTKQCTLQECTRQIPIIEQLCQKCLQREFEAGQEQERSDNYQSSIEQLKQAIEDSRIKCNEILEKQAKAKQQLKDQFKKYEEQALRQLDILFNDLMKKRDEYVEMLEMIGQPNNQNQSQQEFYQLTYKNLKIYLDGLEKKQPHEFNNNALQFGDLIDKYLHSQDMSFINFNDTLQNDIRQIGKFNLDIFSEDENIRTTFGCLQYNYNQIIQLDSSNQIKNIFIPARNSVVVNNSLQNVPDNQNLEFKEENRIFKYYDSNFYQNNKKNGDFSVEVNAVNGVTIKYEKLKYENNQLINPHDQKSCYVIVDRRKGEFNGFINPQTLELVKGTLTFRNQINNQTHHYDGEFNGRNFFFRGIMKTTDQGNKEICFQGYFDYKLQQQGKGCKWVHHNNKNILKYLGGFHNGIFDSQGTVKTLCRQKYNNNTIFIGLCINGQQQDEGKIYYLKDELLQLLDNFEEVDIDKIDNQPQFSLIEQIEQSDQKYEIKTTQAPTCQIF